VESKEQWECLRELQCDEVQGYLFGRPVPVNEIEATYRDILMGNQKFDKQNHILQYLI
jgi:EAL domain-containing protein (putative c-di-GMP-specific phosphodiesterase class I)